MTKSEQNKEYGKLLAKWYYECNIDKLPIILNSEQYETFVKEWKELDNKKLMKKCKELL